jgi:pyridoxal phosphate enzyme (YggS family)
MNPSPAQLFRTLRSELDEELRRSGRAPGSARILGVSKKQRADAILEAIRGGLDAIGENYVQESKQKFAELGGVAVEKHFIGHFQTNKAKQIATLFDVVQSVDRIETATALAAAAEKIEKRLKVLVQVNISPGERFGAAPGDAERIANAVRAARFLELDGVMAVGPITEDREEISRAFETAAKTFAVIGGNTLSIGMSGDWREAVRAGSTMVRIGTAIFGQRVPGR